MKEFEDRPFRQLSSGMKSRLAFSIASMVKPDILILDEVLSVGDGAFRKRANKNAKYNSQWSDYVVSFTLIGTDTQNVQQSFMDRKRESNCFWRYKNNL